jgi:cysteine desulfurase
MISAEHYFDFAATSPFDGEILEAALKISEEHWGNPSSIHEAGTDAKKFLDDARNRCAEVLGVKSDSIFFTSGGTEGDHIPLLSVLNRPQKGSVVLSAIEHPALREISKSIENCGWKTIFVNPDKNGIVSAENILKAVQDDTVFVSVMAVNNETGAIQPVYEIADGLQKKSAEGRKIFFHVDCVQAAGKIPLEIFRNGIDGASFSAHKIGGPRGIGLLYLAKKIEPFLRGGGQEKNIRSGTENLFGAEAMALCLEKYFIREKNGYAKNRFDEQKILTREFIESLRGIKNFSLLPHSRQDMEEKFSPWIVQSSFSGIPGQVMERALSSDGFFISTGSACSSAKKSRPILDTMQIPQKEKESAVRFSFGFSTTKKQMQELSAEIKKVCKKFGVE